MHCGDYDYGIKRRDLSRFMKNRIMRKRIWWYDGGSLMMYDAYVGVELHYKV